MEDRERELVVALVLDVWPKTAQLVVALEHEEVIWGQEAQVWLRAGATSAKSFLVCKWNT